MSAVTALEQLGATQQKLLRCLLYRPAGVAVDELVRQLAVTATAVRQHLAALQRDGIVRKGPVRPTSRRPQQLYELSEDGKEIFPRNYGLMAHQIIEKVRQQIGSQGLSMMMRELGTERGRTTATNTNNGRLGETAEHLARHMQAAGYEAHTNTGTSDAEVVALNCVFHHLAAEYPEVCEYDLAFIEAASGKTVEHTECMLRGGVACRFRLRSGKSASVKYDDDTTANQ